MTFVPHRSSSAKFKELTHSQDGRVCEFRTIFVVERILCDDEGLVHKLRVHDVLVGEEEVNWGNFRA